MCIGCIDADLDISKPEILKYAGECIMRDRRTRNENNTRFADIFRTRLKILHTEQEPYASVCTSGASYMHLQRLLQLLMLHLFSMQLYHSGQ